MRTSRIRQTLLASVFAGALAAPALAQTPKTLPDENWITVSGKVTNAAADRFQLDYGADRITVEMDSWQGRNSAWPLKNGDQVTVSGRIDHDLFENASIEASTVYVENLNTHFFASPADEENMVAWITVSPYEGDIAFRGTVSEVDAAEGEFMLDTGTSAIRVDVDKLGYNPFDQAGYQRIEEGDRLSVTGMVDNGLFENREIMAVDIVTLDEAKSTASLGGQPASDLAESQASLELAADVNLPAEVRRTAADGDYTTKDLVLAQLEAINES